MPAKAPRVSVLTIHRGPVRWIEALKNGLARQTFSASEFEWVLIDDHSSESPPGWFYSPDTKFSLNAVRMKQNVGRSKARNQAVKRARGKIVAFIDSDMEPSPTWLECLVRAVERTGGVIIGAYDPLPGGPRSAYVRYAHSRGVRKLEPGSRAPAKYFVTNNCAFPREAVKTAGTFDEGFTRWGGEDLEYGLRLEKAGFSLFYEPRARTWQDFRVSWWEQERRYLAYGHTGVLRIIERHPEAVELLSLHRLKSDHANGFFHGLALPALLQLACTRKVYSFVSRLVNAAPDLPWPDCIFDYMIFCLYSRGYHQRLEGVKE